MAFPVGPALFREFRALSLELLELLQADARGCKLYACLPTTLLFITNIKEGLLLGRALRSLSILRRLLPGRGIRQIFPVSASYETGERIRLRILPSSSGNKRTEEEVGGHVLGSSSSSSSSLPCIRTVGYK
jgi:hypothetical protein